MFAADLRLEEQVAISGVFERGHFLDSGAHFGQIPTARPQDGFKVEVKKREVYRSHEFSFFWGLYYLYCGRSSG